MRVLIVGCGYVGLPLGAELVKQGHEVIGVRRAQDAETAFTTQSNGAGNFAKSSGLVMSATRG